MGGMTLDSAVSGRLLATMPLHAITSVYGEDGLRERLLMEISVFPADERARVEQAMVMASGLHASDRRQREPYVNHLLRVAIRVVSHYRVSDPDLECAAVLHDSVEDHSAEIAPGGREEALAVLAEQFGGRVARLVSAVTNPEREPGRDRHEQYREHVVASLRADPWARVIKVSDFTDNAVGLMHTTGPKVTKLAAKYRPLVPVLREIVLRADTPLQLAVKGRIVRQLDNAETRFASILD
jgi:(p)ppGpp synthase/HD superfamily hydrolase